MVCPLVPGPKSMVVGISPGSCVNDGSFTLMYMASLMFLVSPCASLSTMVKHSGLTGYPVVDVCKCMCEGSLRYVPCTFPLVFFQVLLCIVLCS